MEKGVEPPATERKDRSRSEEDLTLSLSAEADNLNCEDNLETGVPDSSVSWIKLFPSLTEDRDIVFPVNFTKNVLFGNPFYAKPNRRGKDMEVSFMKSPVKTIQTDSLLCKTKSKRKGYGGLFS